MFGTSTVIKAIDELKASVGGLQEALTETVKQGLADIKAAIDEIRGAAQRTSESAASISGRVDTLHTEIQGLRADVDRLRDATRTAAESRSDDRILRDIADLKATVEGWRADAAEEARRAAVEVDQGQEQQTQAAPDAPDPGDFEELLALAAGVAYAEISCHRDTWDFLVAQSSRGQHFRLPGAVREDDCLIDADLSGRTLIAVLDALWHTQHDQEAEPGSRHLAAKVYGRIGDALSNVDPGGNPSRPRSGGGSSPDVTRIVIDDRPTAETTG